MKIIEDEKFLYELCYEGRDIPGYYRLKRFIGDFETAMPSVRSVLDAGCGTGIKSIYLARKHPELQVIGIDSNKDALNYPVALKEKYRLQNVRFYHMDLTTLPDLESFDFIIASDVLEHIEDDKQFAANLNTLLEQGGYVYINAPSKEHDYDPSKLSPNEQEQLAQWLKDAGHVRLGYTPDELTDLFPGYKVINLNRVGNCCAKMAFFFWEKAFFDPTRQQPGVLKREYNHPLIGRIDSLLERYFAKETAAPVSTPPMITERMFLQAIRSIDLGIDLENRGLLDKRYLTEEEYSGLLQKPTGL